MQENQHATFYPELLLEFLKGNKAVWWPADKGAVYRRVGHSINMLALLITSCVRDKGQTAGERNATWQKWTRAIFSLAGHTPAPELSPPRLFTWPIGEGEREGCLSHLSSSQLSISLSLWWQRLSLRISAVLRTGHQLPRDTLHYLPPVSSSTAPKSPACFYNVSRSTKGL